MADLSRRKFLSGSALGVAAGIAAGVAGAAGVSAVPRLLGARSGEAAAPDDLLAGESLAGESVVAHVRDAATGEVAVMVGTNELVYRDRELASRLMKAARRAAAEG